ncbi:class I SAM-dependent methyltransferase [Streptomyces sp. DSM 44915]|uniref:Class I SAM-dependent methyltransferase n=1 Tax=Streptomyces chisholmiae TaxID=3075540 RepID=A0ABU2JRH0_9ACTN|nr:class I SAM-dependent methyltransferase [Streptomyces sp. DSM 44915]MDT0267343.1 class I SAM-dependent methyltransferase [Streptomyces sp. DSM 44915]
MTDSAAARAYWDAAADAFDQAPDHGLRQAATRGAWAARLASWIPRAPADVLDVGCGTGSLTLLLAEAGHRVTGVDLAPRMVGHARAKLAAAGLAGRFLVGDAAQPPTRAAAFDVVLSRHLVWTLADPAAALRAWVARLRPGGTLVLVEGRWRQAGEAAPYVPGAERLPWHGGVTARELTDAVRPLVSEVRVEQLGHRPLLWGGPVTDERYALIARA